MFKPNAHFYVRKEFMRKDIWIS